jgi:anti-sigma factor RsiW
MIGSANENDELQLNAYCDGELDPMSAVAFERRMADDALLKAQYVRLLSLRRAVRSLPLASAPPGLSASINARLNADRVVRAVRPPQRKWSLQALAAAAVFGAVLSSSVMLTMERYNLHEDVAQQVVAGHIRGLLAPQPFDVASSDRHTVKPWFTSRLPESPQVPDLASEGFMLVGGRVDVVGHDPVATIVYKHAKHMVSLTTLPPDQSVPDRAISGYNVRSWSDAQFTYVAVSDLPAPVLVSFEQAFSAASKPQDVK